MWAYKFYDPANPIVTQNFVKYLLLYYGTILVLMYVWDIYRNYGLPKRKHRVSGDQQGYKVSRIGSLLKIIVILSSLPSFILLIIHTFDTAGCSRQNLTPYWDIRAPIFIMLWVLSFTTCIIYRILESLIKSFFLIPCNLEEAEFVNIWSSATFNSGISFNSKKKSALFEKAISLILIPFSKFRSLLNNEFDGLYVYTVKVYRSSSDGINNRNIKAHFELFCTRYWYSKELGMYTNLGANDCSETNEKQYDTIGSLGNEIYSVKKILNLDQFKVKVRSGERFLNGLSSECVDELRQIHGFNNIPVQLPSLLYSLVKEITNPLTVFQLLVVASFAFQGFVLYPVKWVPMMILSIIASIRTHLKSTVNIQKLADMNGSEEVTLIRDGQLQKVNSVDLVPGDVVNIYEGMDVPCDMMLIYGSAVVNESMLTGESAEIVKFPVTEYENDDISPDDGVFSGKKFFLYAGTHVTGICSNTGLNNTLYYLNKSTSQTSTTRSTDSSLYSHSLDFSDAFISNPELPTGSLAITVSTADTLNPDPMCCVALVVRTGVSTLRGRIIRSILYPSKFMFALYDQIPIIWLVATTIVTIIIFNQGQLYNWHWLTFFFSLGCINVVYPLYLTVLCTLSQNISAWRLKKNNINVLVPTRLMMAGKLRIVCFDKTGTLTSEHLEFVGIHPFELVDNGRNSKEKCTDWCNLESYPLKSNCCNFSFRISPKVLNISEIKENYLGFLIAMSSCTSLSHGRSNFGIAKDIVNNPEEYYKHLNGNDTDKALFSVTSSYFERNSVSQQVYVNLYQSMEKISEVIEYKDQFMLNLSNNGNEDSNNSVSLCTTSMSLEILRVFPFDYNRRLMSVIVHCKSTNNFYLFSKGAPEAIQKLYDCEFEESYKEDLESLSLKGYYLISMGFKKIEYQYISSYLTSHRNEVENKLIPMGILLFDNKIRPEAQQILNSLVNSDILPIMITGDSAYTSVNVARRLDILRAKDTETAISELDENNLVSWRCIGTGNLIQNSYIYSAESMGTFKNLVLTGECFERLLEEHKYKQIQEISTCIKLDKCTNSDAEFEEVQTFLCDKKSPLESILNRVSIYARMCPTDKVNIVNFFMNKGIVTGMVGDGGNDCGALTIAHIGLSFSRGDASLVAPFNSPNCDLNSVLSITREGRNNLAIAMSALQFPLVYGILVSLMDVLLVHFAFASNSDLCSSYTSFFIHTSLLIGILFSSPAKKLAAARPSGSIANIRILLSFLLPIVSCLLGYLFMMYRLSAQPWFKSSKSFNLRQPTQNWFFRVDNIEASSSWIFKSLQIAGIAIGYTIGGQFRKPFYKNIVFMIPLVFNIILFTILVLTGPNALTCCFRINCNVGYAKKASLEIFGYKIIGPSSIPFTGPNGSNIMPFSWKIELLAICLVTIIITNITFILVTRHNEKFCTSKLRNF
ncbi:E1-E2 ATPase family protein [Cryptosporidium andersoni]|uniref:E1-E2 ATPase family protein n=1 Tax=Cryptosporidium andersoni TaxID=117008 RepID=A0A1J4MUE8_9CRYT|nr:E1-E2 ATPase family protein [Cryptosporidium andersoni]